MVIKNKFLVLSALASALVATSANALVLPLSVGADAGVTDVKYKSQSATGFFWAVNGRLHVTDYTSIYTGYGETTAEFPDADGVDQDFTSTSIPLALQVSVPIVMGRVYVRGGGNYYENTYVDDVEDGWGLLGAVGISVTPGLGPGFNFELGYRDSGSAETSSVSIGVNASF